MLTLFLWNGSKLRLKWFLYQHPAIIIFSIFKSYNKRERDEVTLTYESLPNWIWLYFHFTTRLNTTLFARYIRRQYFKVNIYSRQEGRWNIIWIWLADQEMSQGNKCCYWSCRQQRERHRNGRFSKQGFRDLETYH